MISVGQTALLAGTISTGLVAGIFVAFSISIMPGLAKTDDATFVHAMQQINVAILNPVFLFLFMLPLPALGWLPSPGRRGSGSSWRWCST